MPERLYKVGSEIDPTELTNPTLAFLRRYWDEKRGDRLMPSRRDIRPSELKEHLGWVLMIEVFPDLSDFRYKLIGTLVTQYFLSDSTGKTVSEAFAQHGPAATNAVKAILRKTARDRVPMRAFGKAGWVAPGYEQFDALYLPLSDDGETVNMILHGFVFDRPSVMMAREIARAHGGRLLVMPDTFADLDKV